MADFVSVANTPDLAELHSVSDDTFAGVQFINGVVRRIERYRMPDWYDVHADAQFKSDDNYVNSLIDQEGPA